MVNFDELINILILLTFFVLHVVCSGQSCFLQRGVGFFLHRVLSITASIMFVVSFVLKPQMITRFPVTQTPADNTIGMKIMSQINLKRACLDSGKKPEEENPTENKHGDHPDFLTRFSSRALL